MCFSLPYVLIVMFLPHYSVLHTRLLIFPSLVHAPFPVCCEILWCYSSYYSYSGFSRCVSSFTDLVFVSLVAFLVSPIMTFFYLTPNSLALSVWRFSFQSNAVLICLTSFVSFLSFLLLLLSCLLFVVPAQERRSWDFPGIGNLKGISKKELRKQIV